MDSKKLIENENRYIDEHEYSEGYVCFIDILGFSNLIKDSDFNVLKETYNEILFNIINFDLNFKNKFCILSDSIVVTLNKNDLQYPDAEVKSLVLLCCMFRKIIFQKLRLEIRAGITYGKYLQSGIDNFIIFGPAVIAAYKLAEQLNKFEDIPEIINDGRPANIVIDRSVFQSNQGNILIDYYLKKHVVLKSGYVLINPFLEDGFVPEDREFISKKYIDFCEKEVDKEYISKYKNTMKFATLTLNNNDDNKKLEFFGNEVCITSADKVQLNELLFNGLLGK